MTIKADCNQVTAEYVVGAEDALTITLGPTTLAQCAEGSRSEQFVEALGQAYSFQTEEENLVIVGGDQPTGQVFQPAE